LRTAVSRSSARSASSRSDNSAPPVGLTHGDLFSHVIAFSPGFAAPGQPLGGGRPAVYITHGVDDRVLPVDRTSRRLRPRLERAGYPVVYEEFSGGHVVPKDRAERALDWFLQT
jgi:phospholipase/carboxylesterase